MVDITVSDKQMKPQVIHTDQFENGVNTIRFIIEDYMQGSTDLQKFKAYAVTSLNGEIDITEVPYTVSGRVMTLTWALSAYTLRNPGVIQYQLRFSQSEADGTAVWSSYKGVIVNRLAINADDYISANYPTLLKENQDLIHTLSGAFGAEIVYMPVGEPIPVEERLAGRLYYQWLDTPTTTAKCATGTVNLGERPLADSGLYINGVHIFVDNTSEEAYVLGASAWIEAVAAANCGVTASDISEGKDTILLISAKNAGEAGNKIGLELGLALYGAGANTTNPSGGRVSGSTLVGGSDAVTGSDKPVGRFEDAHGNILGYDDTLATKQELTDGLGTKVDKNSSWCAPDWSKVSTVTLPYTATSMGWIILQASTVFSSTIYINNVEVSSTYASAGSYGDSTSTQMLISSGDVVRIDNSNSAYNSAKFVPCKGS